MRGQIADDMLNIDQYFPIPLERKQIKITLKRIGAGTFSKNASPIRKRLNSGEELLNPAQQIEALEKQFVGQGLGDPDSVYLSKVTSTKHQSRENSPPRR